MSADAPGRGGSKHHPDDDPEVPEEVEIPTPELIQRMLDEHEAAIARMRSMNPDPFAAEWKVTVPEYDWGGVLIERFEVTEFEAVADKLRNAYNPQRPNRSVDPGIYTRLTVDGAIWMTDTPAEVRDHMNVDKAMAQSPEGTALIAGLGLGLIVNRAIVKHRMLMIDVVEIDQRVLDAVGPHYMALASEHGCQLYLHHSDIHEWRPPPGQNWDVAWWDIWPTINDEDMAEVQRLNVRFRRRTRWRGSWAQDDRIRMKRRIKSGKWAY